MKIPDNYWEERYQLKQTGWDIGSVSPPLKEYFDQLSKKDLRILIPGAGRAWEAEYLFKNGFSKVFVLDYSTTAISDFLKRYPYFPKNQIINDDFFKHKGQYDLIVEQTFFSALLPTQRQDYAISMYEKLCISGKLVGLLFNHEFAFTGPPFGGTVAEYTELFSPMFEIEILETATNSIEPRMRRELFILLRKNSR